MEPREITFEEIRKGDRLRIESDHRGVREVVEGVADTQEFSIWGTNEGGILISLEDSRTSKITLLDRPRPPLPTDRQYIGRAVWEDEERTTEIGVFTPAGDTNRNHFGPGGRLFPAGIITFLREIPAELLADVESTCSTCNGEGETRTMLPGLSGEPVEGMAPCPDCKRVEP